MTKTELVKAFISYSRKDSEFVNALRTVLLRSGVKVWQDTIRIHIGDLFHGKINQAIDNSDVFILVVSKFAIDSKWVKKELNRALDLNRKSGLPRIFPLLIDDCKIPDEIQDTHYLDFRNKFEQPLHVLLSTILEMDNSKEPYKSTNVLSSPYKDTQQNEAVLLYNQALLLYREGKLDEMIKYLLEAYELDPHNLDIPYNLAVATYDLALQKNSQQLMEAAANYYEDIVKLRPDDVDALVNLGVIYNTRDAFGKIERAKELFEKAVTIAPDYALAHLNLGYYYSFDGGLREVSEQLDESKTQDTNGVTIKPESLRKALLYYAKALELDNNLLLQCLPMYKAIKELLLHLGEESST